MRSLILALIVTAGPALAVEPSQFEISTRDGCESILAVSIRGALSDAYVDRVGQHAELVPEPGREHAREYADLQRQIAELEAQAVQALMRACSAY